MNIKFVKTYKAGALEWIGFTSGRQGKNNGEINTHYFLMGKIIKNGIKNITTKTQLNPKSFIVLKLAYGYQRKRLTEDEIGKNCTCF